MTPRQPNARSQGGGDLNDENDDSLRGSALLAESNGESEGYIDREQGACEQLGTVSVVVVQRPKREEGPCLVVQFACARESQAEDQEGGDENGEEGERQRGQDD